MQNEKNKLGLDALWKKYQKTLEMLNDALEQLEKKPKEVEKIVEVEQIKEVPVTEFVEVPKIVEVEVVKEITAEQKAQYETRIAELENEIQQLKENQYTKPLPNIDYWGRPKNPSKRLVDEQFAEQKLKEKYQRLVEEVKNGKLDINTLTNAEQEIVTKLLKNE